MNDRPWYRVRLSADPAGARRQIEIQNIFERVYIAAGGPRDAAMYSTGLSGPNGFCAYFSPGTMDRFEPFLRQIGAEAAAMPTDVMGFLVGHTETMRELLGNVPGGA